jgi:hypothetical protein
MKAILEVNDEGALVVPPELLNGAVPHQRYSAELAGDHLHLRPERASQEKLSSDEWWTRWAALSEQIGKKWTSDKSAAEIVSEMRR